MNEEERKAIMAEAYSSPSDSELAKLLIRAAGEIDRLTARLAQLQLEQGVAIERAAQAEELLAKDPDVDWPEMAKMLAQAEQERDGWRDTAHAAQEQALAFNLALARLRTERDEADAEIERLSRRHTKACDRNWGTCSCERLEHDNARLTAERDAAVADVTRAVRTVQQRDAELTGLRAALAQAEQERDRFRHDLKSYQSMMTDEEIDSVELTAELTRLRAALGEALDALRWIGSDCCTHGYCDSKEHRKARKSVAALTTPGESA